MQWQTVYTLGDGNMGVDAGPIVTAIGHLCGNERLYNMLAVFGYEGLLVVLHDNEMFSNMIDSANHFAEDPAAELCVAVVRDISASGARVWLEPEASLDRMASVTLEIRVPAAGRRVAVAAEMVRIAGQSAQSVEVAFRLLDSEKAADSLSELLALLAER